MNNLIITKNAWKYFPDKKGFINGINLSASGISSSFLTPIADFGIINPDKKNTDSDGLYSEEVANRLPRYLYILIGIFLIIGSISYFTTFNYEDNIDIISNDINEEKLIGNINEEEDEEINSEKEKENKEKIDKKSLLNKYPKSKITTKELLNLFLSWKNAQILSISIGGPCKKILD